MKWTYVATPEKIRIPMIPHVVNTPMNDDNDKYRRGTKLSGRTLDISSCPLISAQIGDIRREWRYRDAHDKTE